MAAKKLPPALEARKMTKKHNTPAKAKAKVKAKLSAKKAR